MLSYLISILNLYPQKHFPLCSPVMTEAQRTKSSNAALKARSVILLSVRIKQSTHFSSVQTRFIARDSIYAKRAYAIAIPSVCPSVRLSVRHTGGSVKNG